MSGCSTEGNSTFTGSYAGAIASYADYSTFTDCYTDTTYELIGRAWECTIQ